MIICNKHGCALLGTLSPFNIDFSPFLFGELCGKQYLCGLFSKDEIMKKITKWVTIVAMLCSINLYCSCCKEENADAVTEVVSTELLRTNQSWNGVDLPNYPQGSPELVAVKYVIPAGEKLGWHHHDAMNHGVLVQGELTIIGLDGKTKTMHEGEVVVEMVDSIHHGENRGTEPVVLYMFYLSQKGLPLSVQHPEIPME